MKKNWTPKPGSKLEKAAGVTLGAVSGALYGGDLGGAISLIAHTGLQTSLGITGSTAAAAAAGTASWIGHQISKGRKNPNLGAQFND